MSHLGGHLNRTWVDQGVFNYITDRFGIRSVVDIGCGPGGMREIAQSRGIEWLGIDGDPEVAADGVVTHDFNNGPPDLGLDFDLGWSVEFLEHVYEEYQPNYMDVFGRCNYVVCTAAPPGWGGHHHVNEQPREYWTEAFSRYGFTYDDEVTQEMIRHTTMRFKKGRNFMMASGMFYRRNNV